MTKITDEDRNLIEQSIYLPMLITLLNRDLLLFQKAPFKLKQPYIEFVEQTMNKIQRDLRVIKQELRKRKIKIVQEDRDEAFTQYLFVYKGYEEHHNFFNPTIRNNVQSLMQQYFIPEPSTKLTERSQ